MGQQGLHRQQATLHIGWPLEAGINRQVVDYPHPRQKGFWLWLLARCTQEGDVGKDLHQVVIGECHRFVDQTLEHRRFVKVRIGWEYRRELGALCTPGFQQQHECGGELALQPSTLMVQGIG
ncbi:hypothetical protein D3C81_853080 [compost metagenome]